MSLPFFYISEYEGGPSVTLNEESSRHVVQVLRMKLGEAVNLTDGKGKLLTCSITDVHKKHCVVRVNHQNQLPRPIRQVTIALSLIKNANRFEWFVEKATEIGVTAIIPLICERTEKERFRTERMLQICVSAMLQSQQCWLPVLREPVLLADYWQQEREKGQHFIAHCERTEKRELSDLIDNQTAVRSILIGPEGDFSSEEISVALQYQFIPVSLGATRLRTETAGLVAATLLSR
ncbi:MAG: RsmE family RNA methyltransferase [Terrimonas sp.]|nr:RsmE family RNA methyltransferase [Terrimonas sp.]